MFIGFPVLMKCVLFICFRPELNIVALQPWTNLKVPEKLDIALEEVCI